MRRRYALPSRAAPALAVALIAALAATGCRKAPPPEEIPVDLDSLDSASSAYGNLHAHDELFEPEVRALLQTSQKYLDAGEDGCFRLPDLTTCDLHDFCGYDRDPAGIAAVAHAQLFDAATDDVVSAVLNDDLTEVYPSTFLDYEVVQQTDRAAFLAGERDLYDFTYTCALDVVLDQVSYYNVMNVRRLPDWDGTGQPAYALRGYMPEPASANLDTTEYEQLYSLELIVPYGDGSQTLRLLSSWSGLRLGDLVVADVFNMACSNIRENFDDIERFLQAQR